MNLANYIREDLEEKLQIFKRMDNSEKAKQDILIVLQAATEKFKATPVDGTIIRGFGLEGYKVHDSDYCCECGQIRDGEGASVVGS